MKILHWMIALCGLWEFGDIAAIFVPGFGHISAFLWNHIIAGFVLMVVGAWAALAGSPGMAKRLDWVAAAAGAWLVVAPFILGAPAISAGRWNDMIVGAIVFSLSVWAALAARRSRANNQKE